MKYIIDIPDDRIGDFVGSTHLLMPYTMAGHNGHHDTGLKLTPYTEPNRKAIEDEVWDFARRIICPSDCCEDSISKYTEEFLGIPSHKARAIFKDLSYQEAKAKYEAWKKRNDEIRVGDEVVDTETDKGVVTYIRGYVCDVLWDDGGVTEEVEREELYKTGRHFPEIAELLKKMRDSDD